MKARFAIIAAGIILLAATAAKAAPDYFIRGSTVMQWCTTSPSDPAYERNITSCEAYVAGAVDDLLVQMDIAKRPYCLTDETTRDDLMQAVVQYLEKEPVMQMFSAALVVRETMQDRYGCRLDQSR